MHNPILKVLSTFQRYNVKSLLIGGQACIIYGAAEFSRDSDFVILCNQTNLKQLNKALVALKAEPIYVPALSINYLRKGHACHFRCQAKDVEGLRIDLLSKLRGCDSFEKLWQRRKTIFLKDGNSIDVIGLFDLVQSKKTQRDKDWSMLKRLLENDILVNKDNPLPKRVVWWLLESRNVDSLLILSKEYPQIVKRCISKRPLLSFAVDQKVKKLNQALVQEEFLERQRDTEYWKPLREELENLRHKLINNRTSL
jgi:hypothetical protein